MRRQWQGSKKPQSLFCDSLFVVDHFDWSHETQSGPESLLLLIVLELAHVQLQGGHVKENESKGAFHLTLDCSGLLPNAQNPSSLSGQIDLVLLW